MIKLISMGNAIISSNTGLDAITRAPIVEYKTKYRCLRIQNVSREESYENWGYTSVSEENYKRFQLKEDDIIVSRTGGSIGTLMFIDKDYNSVYNNGLICLKIDKKKYNPRYIYYCLKLDGFKKHIQKCSLGNSTQENIRMDDMLEYMIPDFDLRTQEQIVDVLKALDTKIQNNIAINAELEAMARTIYDYWFLQFDFPDENGKPYKSSGGKMVWNEELKREIPEGWRAYKIAECVKCNEMSLGKNEEFSEINYLDTSNLTENKIESIVNIQKDKGYPSRAKRIISQNDILISTVRPEQKHYGIIKCPVDNMVASTGFTVLSSKFGSDYNEIFYLFFTHKTNIDILDTIANSSVSSYPSINSDDILNLNISLPKDIKKLDDIARIFNKFFHKMAILQEENKELSSLRDFLLPLLMNGQVGFKEC